MRQVVGNHEKVYLISCVSKKCSGPAPAKELYLSEWFKKARRFVEHAGCPWFVLSAEYGLVSPDQVLVPYDKTLNTMPISERRKWAEKVMTQIEEVVPQLELAVVLAGKRYREFLTGHLQRRNVAVDVPMEGLKIGEQLRWLGNHGG